MQSVSLLGWGMVFFAYSLVMIFGALVWCWFVVVVDRRSMDYRLFSVFYICNIQKYLPGNVFQFLGRSFYGSKLGFSQEAVWLANLIEVAAVVVSVFLLCVLGVVVFWKGVLLQILDANILLAVLLLGVALFAVVLHPGTRHFSRADKLLRLMKSCNFIVSIAVYCLIFALLGWVIFFLGGCFFAHPAEFDLFLLVVLSFSVSWLFGFLLPGVPGGVGVRESAFIFLMLAASSYAQEQSLFFSSATAQHEWLFLALAVRLLGFLVEFFFAALSWPVLAKEKLV